MKKLKIMTVVGTRPEIIRLSRVISLLDEHCDHVLVHTGQNYDHELSDIFYDELRLRHPDKNLRAARGTASETIGEIIRSVDGVISEERPDAMLVLGDTNSCLAALPAKKRKVPVFHMEAGNRCFDERVPEEVNRRLVDNLADVNLTYSALARENLIREGFSADRVIKVGSPMYEVLTHYEMEIKRSEVIERLGLREFNYFVASIHREENVDIEKAFLGVIDALNTIAERFGKPVIVSTHPRTRKVLDDRRPQMHALVRFVRPFGFFDYVRLQQGAHAVLSDSGTISEESSILNFPALNLREAHERPEAMEEGAVIMAGLNKERILQGISLLDHQKRGSSGSMQPVREYLSPNVSEKVVRIIHGYTDYINRVVWKKYTYT